MSRYLRHFLCFALVSLWGATDVWAQPQAPGCGTCVCNIAGAPVNADPAVPDPGVGNTSAPVVLVAGRAYRDFTCAANTRYRVRLCTSVPSVNTLLTIRRAAAVGTIIPNACDDDGCGVSGGLSQVDFTSGLAGNYRAFVYVGSCGGAGNLITSNITMTVENLGPDPAPTNDNITCGVSSFPLPLPTFCSGSIPGTTIGATASPAPFNANPLLPNSIVPFSCQNPFQANWLGVVHRDVWFQVPVPPSGMLGLSTTESSLCAGAFALYRNTGDCVTPVYDWVGGVSPAGNSCSNEGLSSPGDPPELVADLCAVGMNPGEYVYIRYWERSNDEQGTFQICAYEPSRPSNDQPCGATVLDVSGTVCVPVNDATNNATPTTGVTVAAPSCGVPAPPVYISGDLWYRFTVPAFPNNNITVSTFAGTLTDMGMAWYRPSPLGANLCPTAATCPPTYAGAPALTEIACVDNTGSDLMPSINNQTVPLVLNGGETIYVRVWSTTPYYGTFSICARRNVPPVNDNPCGAIPLPPVASTCEFLNGTNENATNTGAIQAPAFVNGAPGCGGPLYPNDVWYTTVVPTDLAAPYGMEFSVNAGGVTDAGVAVYRRQSGSCAAGNRNLQVVPGGCATTGNPLPASLMPRVTVNVPNITPGDTLWIRVWRETGGDGTFAICARRTDPVQCEGFIYDPGGPSLNYANNLTGLGLPSLISYCATKVGDVVTLDFQSFQVENFFDVLTIYDGPNTVSPIIGTYTGGQSPGVVTATITPGNPNGCLTLRFTSDGTVTAPGWAAKLYCGPPPPPPPAVVGICNSLVFDPGGQFGNYANNIGYTGNPPFIATYCPNNGNGVADSVVTLTFQSFNVEAFWDAVYVFNGPTPNVATQINSGNPAGFVPVGAFAPGVTNGGFYGTGPPGPFSATISAANPQGCLTLLFVTDFSITLPGWVAQVSCGDPPPPPPPPVVGGGPNVNVVCPGETIFLDDGGNGNYANAVNYTRTFCPSVPGNVIAIDFTSFDVEDGFAANTCWDMLYVYDGPTVASPLFNSGFTDLVFPPFNPFGPGGYCGTALPGPFVSSHPSGCLTFRFWTDNIVIGTGWRAEVQCAQPPPNDNPCTPVGATLVPVNTTCVPQTFTNVISSATPTTIAPAPNCGNFTNADVWFRFVAPPNGRVFINTTAGTMVDAAMELYSAASCAGPFTSVECDDDDGENLMPAIDRLCNPLVGGATYWLRVWGYGGETGTFDLCITTTSSNTSQQDCAGAFTVCSTSSFTGVSYGNGCTTDLVTANLGCLTGGERQGSWYAFSTQAAGTLGLTITPSSPADIDWAIWGPFPLTGDPTSVGNNCVPSSPPIRCSSASLLNTTTAAGPAAATGMGNPSAALNTPQFAPTLPALRDGGLPTVLPIDGWVPGINIAPNQVYLLFVDDHHLALEDYTVSWNVSPSNAIGCVLLPVDLVTLEAHPKMNTVDLTWTTASEQNSSHFIVERSADGVVYEPIGTVSAMGFTTAPTDYVFTDEKPIRGLNYYRLQQVDLDASSTPTNVVTALFEPDLVTVMVVPNPSRDRAELLMSTAYDGVLQVRISDASGRSVASFRTASGVQRFDLPIEKIEAGSYTDQLLTEPGEVYGRARFVKQ